MLELEITPLFTLKPELYRLTTGDPETNRKVDYLLVGLGTREDIPTNRSVLVHQILDKHKIRHDYYAGGNGAHDWATWRHLLYAKLLPNLWRTK